MLPEDHTRSGLDSGVGATLRAHRLRRRLDLAAVADVLHIRKTYLEFIEQGRYELLPGPTYAAGFVRAYADHLGLDSGDVVRQFKLETLGRTIGGGELHFPSPEGERGAPRAAILVASILLLAAAYAAWFFLSPSGVDDDLVAAIPERLEPAPAGEPAPVAIPVPEGSGQGQAAREQDEPALERQQAAAPWDLPPRDAPPGSPPVGDEGVQDDEALAEETAATRGGDGFVAGPFAPPSAPDEPALETATGQSPTPSGLIDAEEPASEERIVLSATDATWIQLSDPGGRIVLERILQAGETLRVDATRGLSLVTGNAGGLEVSLDGETLAPLGLPGEVKRGIVLAPAVLSPPAPASAPVAVVEQAPVEPERAAAPTAPGAAAAPSTIIAAEPVDVPFDDGERMVLRAVEDAWIQLRDRAGRIVFSRVLEAGEMLPVDPARGLSLVTGNAGGLEIVLDGEILPPLGRSGQVVRGVALDPAALRPAEAR